MHYYSHHIADFRKDTSHLSLLEQGLYRRLLDQYYLDEKPLGLDHVVLMRAHCVRTADEKQAFDNVLQDFFIRTEDGYVHKRCEIEIGAFHAKSQSAAESAKARWARVRAEKEAAAMRTHSDGNANHEPITNTHQPKKNKPPLGELFPGVSAQVLDDFAAVRKKLRAEITRTAADGMAREAAKAGLALEDALRLCCERGWRAFKAEWVAAEQKARPGSGGAWWPTDETVIAKGRELGIAPHAGESMLSFKARVKACFDSGDKPPDLAAQSRSRVVRPEQAARGVKPEGLDLKSFLKPREAV
ncbi:MAG TPA: YdaU family protein [Burkholderiaceae bacterium]